jgi:CheY-like chemotaxis protein
MASIMCRHDQVASARRYATDATIEVTSGLRRSATLASLREPDLAHSAPGREKTVVVAFRGATTAPPDLFGPGATLTESRHVMADGHQQHVLIVNDTQEIIDLLRELLEDEGYRVSTSLALLDLDKVKELAPDIIVQDLLFEATQEQGWKFLTLARLDPEVRRIPLVLCTAAVQTVKDEEMAAKLEQLGVRVVLKPFDIEELLGVLAETLAAHRSDPA